MEPMLMSSTITPNPLANSAANSMASTSGPPDLPGRWLLRDRSGGRRVTHGRQPLAFRAGRPVLRPGERLADGHEQQVGDEIDGPPQEPLGALGGHPEEIVAPGGP